jgi:hypothetical protein
MIDRVSKNTNMYIVTNGVDEKILNIIKKLTIINKSDTKTAIYNIIERYGPKVQYFISRIITAFISDRHNEFDDIISKKFIGYCMKIFVSSNNRNEDILEVKKILDEWLEMTSLKYQKTNRTATKSAFRKSIFLYFVFSIQKAYHFKG